MQISKEEYNKLKEIETKNIVNELDYLIRREYKEDLLNKDVMDILCTYLKYDETNENNCGSCKKIILEKDTFECKENVYYCKKKICNKCVSKYYSNFHKVCYSCCLSCYTVKNKCQGCNKRYKDKIDKCGNCNKFLCKKCSVRFFDVNTMTERNVHIGFGNYDTFNHVWKYGGTKTCLNCINTLVNENKLMFVRK